MNAKTVFQTDRAGLYVGPVEADESPLEPGVYLMPARAVEAAPPGSWPDEKWPRWNGVAWELVTNPVIAMPQADATAKLRAFLQSNPDVAELIGM
ncbi:phage tail protein [Burkholderia sp. Bp8986]|uniref:phage tail protein n=1 Tax=Burkholderia sp. Bp8986 TaxID=2184550 RepID=UPI000F5A4674|nr:phage tail protein [Burkholderia sp. Bp8986]RQS60419.1 phage tail protein [Burkholderia sp. Bp8986]